MQRILLFERFINSKAYKATNAVNDTDDVKQEVYIHLMKVLPRYMELSEKERKSVIFKTIDNKIIDLVRKSMRKPDTSLFACDENIEQCAFVWEDNSISDNLSQLKNIADLNQEQVIMLMEFTNHIKKFGDELKNEKHQQFIKALINPPRWIEDTWEELRWTKAYTKTRYADRIPTYTIGKLLGLRGPTISKLLKQLTTYLNDLGYEVKRHNVAAAT